MRATIVRGMSVSPRRLRNVRRIAWARPSALPEDGRLGVTTVTVDGPRACRPHELGSVIDFANLVFFHPHGSPPRIATLHPELFTEANRAGVRLVRVDGHVAAAVTVFALPMRCVGPAGRSRLLAGCVGTVATHPDYRRQGFGRAVLRDALAHMREIGCDVGWLGTGIPAFYRALGWENAGSLDEFRLDRSHVDLLPTGEGLGLRCGPGGDASVVTTLAAAEPVASERDSELTRVRLDHVGREVWAAYRGRDAIAYVVFDSAADGDKALEHAGPADAVAAIIGAWLRARDDPERGWRPPAVPAAAAAQPPAAASTSSWGQGSANWTLQVSAPDAPGGLAQHLLDLGLPHRRGYQGMLRAIRPADLLRKLGCVGVAVEAEDDQSVTVRVAGAPGRLTHGRFARWVFGPERVPGAPGLPCASEGAWPVRFHLSPLDHV